MLNLGSHRDDYCWEKDRCGWGLYGLRNSKYTWHTFSWLSNTALTLSNYQEEYRIPVISLLIFNWHKTGTNMSWTPSTTAENSITPERLNSPSGCRTFSSSRFFLAAASAVLCLHMTGCCWSFYLRCFCSGAIAKEWSQHRCWCATLPCGLLRPLSGWAHEEGQHEGRAMENERNRGKKFRDNT